MLTASFQSSEMGQQKRASFFLNPGAECWIVELAIPPLRNKPRIREAMDGVRRAFRGQAHYTDLKLGILKSLSPERPPELEWRFAVKNSGTSLPSAHLTQLFAVFPQLHVLYPP